MDACDELFAQRYTRHSLYESCRKVVQQKELPIWIWSLAPLNVYALSLSLNLSRVSRAPEAVPLKLFPLLSFAFPLNGYQASNPFTGNTLELLTVIAMEFETAVVGFVHVLLLVKIHCTTSPSAKPETVKYGLFNLNQHHLPAIGKRSTSSVQWLGRSNNCSALTNPQRDGVDNILKEPMLPI